jgi:hypothetical protein
MAEKTNPWSGHAVAGAAELYLQATVYTELRPLSKGKPGKEIPCAENYESNYYNRAHRFSFSGTQNVSPVTGMK